jgi:uncharacterized protein YbjQ (UPF0145 family)
MKPPPFPRTPPPAYPRTPSNLIVTSGNDIAGHEITQYLGIVRGIIVRSTGIGRGIVGGLRSIGGGNIPEYVAVCEEARQHAYSLMVEHANQMRADAVIAFRYDATEFMQACTEVLAYGTAVKLAKTGSPVD